MGYELIPGESCDTTVRRIVAEQLGAAIDALQGDESARHQGVHKARKACKKARAALRLARGSMEGKIFRRLNTAIRDAQGELSQARDSVVIIQSLDSLRAHCPEGLDTKGIAAFRQGLVERCRRMEAERFGDAGAFKPVVARLRSIREAAGSLPLDAHGFDVFRPGLRRIYRAGRSLRSDAFRDFETAHEWRKQVKTVWYAVRLIEPVWKGPLGGFGEELETLGERLGDHHDLAVLLQASAGMALDKDTVAVLKAAVKRRQTDLEGKSIPLGEKIFAERAGRFLDRIEAYWAVWDRKARGHAAAYLGHAEAGRALRH